ncbi:HdaA/DnaA family protein [Pseudemcibacter aquimaris]|uniref:HdaA/DnaA family protein n=1 Tax=Pseudemcibacter aquimaris TaxID=2857064 RepID=UPI002013055E|nr:DnaA/Hda family protein [Pseudemcibacter aquimaris]MCC3861095.1 hypothetical protein [Pseudemcibacter aquimaris]WDU59913.1 hypothetical protein KW060_06545 [Pseudemcibacter aquimaris]
MTEAAIKNPEQLLLELPVNETFAEEDFLLSHSNEEAVKWIDNWPDWQGNHCLIIYGPNGCGKTHLSHVWQKISNAQILKLPDLKGNQYTKFENFVFIIEDVMNDLDQFDAQEDLLHLYNWVKEQGGFLLITARKHPKKWNVGLADLSSRMMAAGAVKIKHPDDHLLQAIIIKQFSDRQVVLTDKVLKYIMKNTERSFAAVRELVRNIDQISLSEQKKITIPVVKRAIGDNIDDD